jgi:hypothetical protein
MGNYVQPDFRNPSTAPVSQPGYVRNPLNVGAPTTPYQQPGTQNPMNSGSVGVQIEAHHNPLNITGPLTPHADAAPTPPANPNAGIQVVNKNPLNVQGAQPVYVQPGTTAPQLLPGQLSDAMGNK